MDQKYWLNMLAGSLPTILLFTALFLIRDSIPLSNAVGYVVIIILGLLAGIVLAAMANGTINLSKLISEDNGNASLSRFQFLVFTFVIGGSYFLLMVLYATHYTEMAKVITDGAAAASKPGAAADATAKLQAALDSVKDMLKFQLPDIPNGVLGLIGLSGGSYVISKGIQKSSESSQGLGLGSITVMNPGAGYARSANITLAISGGGGVNASAYATTDAVAGAITGVTITAPGSGYTSAPTVTVQAPPAGGVQAVFQAVLASS